MIGKHTEIIRWWIRYQGEVIRYLTISDYRPCEDGGSPREYIKRITHKRWSLGCHTLRGQYDDHYAQWYANLPADVWCELDYSSSASSAPSAVPTL